MKYLRLKDELADMVDELAPGDPLPAERALAEQLGASRMTVRKAVDDLAASGRVIRRPGVGTFVAPKVEQPLAATSFSEDMRSRGLEPGSVDLGSEVRSAGAAIGRHLEISPGDLVLSVRRLRLADGAPMAIEVLHVPADVAPGLGGPDLVGRSFYEILRDRYDVHITDGEQTLEATVTDDEESAALEVPLHSPAFLFERTSRDQDARVVEFVRSVYRGDRYRITAPIGRRPTGETR